VKKPESLGPREMRKTVEIARMRMEAMDREIGRCRRELVFGFRFEFEFVGE
jgi:hypothetical protein